MFRVDPPPALLFDLDGTLIHSVPDLRAAVNECLAEDGRRMLSDAEVTGMVGNGARKLLERAYAATGAAPSDEAALDALLDRFLAHYEAAPAPLTHPFPGVVETLARCAEADHPMAVCTNKPIDATRHVLRMLGLDGFFKAVIGGGSTPHLKPHAGPVLATLEALGVSAAHAVFVGDSINDTQAARAAGLPVICVTFGYRHCAAEDLGADLLIDRFDALPDALARLSTPEPEKA